MTLCLSYTIPTDQIANANFDLYPTSENINSVSQAFLKLQSNFYQAPFEGFIIFTTTVLSTKMKYDQGTINITDGSNNNVGTLTFTTLYSDKEINPSDPAQTFIKSLSYPIQTATGIFKDYVGGNVVIDYSLPKRQIWLFKV
jgi:hypothetical protein